MKASVIVPMVAAVFVAGCGNSSSSSKSTPPPPATNASSKYDTGNPLTAAPDYVGAVMQAKKFSENQIDLAYVKQAIQMFQASEGRYPKTLQELVPNYLAKVPVAPTGYKIVYDPATGTVNAARQ